MIDFKNIRQALDSLVSEEARLKKRLESLLRRREDLHTLPLPKKDFIDSIAALFDRNSDPLPELLRVQLGGMMNMPMDDLNYGGRFKPLAWPDGKTISADILHSVFRKEIKGAVIAALETWEWPAEVGPTRAERVKEIAKLDAEIQELHQQLNEIVSLAPGRQGENMRQFKA